MTFYASLNDHRITQCRVTIPYYGAWVADAVIDDSAEISTKCILIIGNLTLVGTVFRASQFSGSRSARIIGGGGGWRKTLAAQSYQNPNGIKKSIPLNDAASAVGEQLSIETDNIIGTHWVREGDKPAERTLSLLTNGIWWIDNNGVTQIRDRITSVISTEFDVMSFSGARSLLSVATEDVAAFIPSRTFTSPTVTSPQKISSVSIDVTNEGKCRLEILSTDA